jgi:hypothetical protein
VSEDTALSEDTLPDVVDNATLQRRLFNQKYQAHKAHKEKRTIDRSTRKVPQPLVIPYGHR